MFSPTTTPWRKMALVAMLGLLAGGCVERTITITSQPSHALVYLNDEEIGRTPVTVSFTFYGVYDVRLVHEGYDPLWTKRETKAPWWEAPGPDLIAETKKHNRVHMDWNFTMQPAQPVDDDAVINRAEQLRAQTLGPTTQPAATQPATRPSRRHQKAAGS